MHRDETDLTGADHGQEQGDRPDVVRRALIEGERSGEPEQFDFVAFIRKKLIQRKG